MSGSLPTFYLLTARKQVMCAVHCQQVRAEIRQLLQQVPAGDFQKRCQPMLVRIHELSAAWLENAWLPNLRNETVQEIKQRLASKSGAGFEQLIGKLSRQRADEDPRRIWSQVEPQVRLNSVADVVQTWLHLVDCLRQTMAVDAERESVMASSNQIIRIQGELTQKSSRGNQSQQEQFDALQQDFENLKRRVSKSKQASRFSDRRLNAMQNYAAQIASYAHERVASLEAPAVSDTAIKVPAGKIALPFETKSLICRDARLTDPAWVPRILYEVLQQEDAPEGIWERLWEHVANLPAGEPCSDEQVALRTLAAQLSLAFEQTVRHATDDAVVDARLAAHSPWLRQTLQRILGSGRKQIDLFFDPQQCVEGSEQILVAAGGRRRVRQTGVRVVEGDQIDWLLPLQIEVPRPRPALEAKLQELAEASVGFPEWLAAMLDRLQRGLADHPRGDQPLADWYAAQAASPPHEWGDLFQDLLRELAIQAAQTRQTEASQQAAALLEILEQSGVSIRSVAPQGFGQGRWTLQAAASSETNEVSSSALGDQGVIGLQVRLPDQSMVRETVVSVTEKSPLVVFLLQSQDRLRLLRRETEQWSGWKAYDALLLGMDSTGSDPTEQLLVAVEWLEAYWQQPHSDSPALANLFRQHFQGLLRALEPAASTQLLPRLDAQTLRPLPLLPTDAEAIEITWADAAMPHAHPLELQRFSVRTATGQPLRQGSVTLSRGPDFCEALTEALHFHQQGEPAPQLPAEHPLQNFFTALPTFLWKPSEFVPFCDQTKSDLYRYLKGSKHQVEGRQWFNDWVHSMLTGDQPFGWFQWFTKQRWFACLPNLDAEQRTAFWPSDLKSGWSGVGVIESALPVGQVCDLQTTTFAVEGKLVTTELSGGQPLPAAARHAAELQRLVTSYRDTENFAEIGRPMMEWVSALRDPLPGNSDGTMNPAIILQVLDGLTQYVAAGRLDVADDCLSTIRQAAQHSGFEIAPSGWEFETATLDVKDVPERCVQHRFGTPPAGQWTLGQFGLTRHSDDGAATEIRPLLVHLSAGPEPAGFAELASLANELAGPATGWEATATEAFQRVVATLNSLPRSVADVASNDPVYAIVDLWQDSNDLLLPYLYAQTSVSGAGQDAVVAESQADRWYQSLSQLAASFNLATYGEAGQRIDALHNNFEAWFDYDPVQLSQASRQSSGGAPMIRQVDRQGLVRNGSATPLLKARVQL